mmetsp:Transcript_42022/g.101262  ORF Transcript_42022/g.101262 Transcript_42022/m.101262 type:complete len:107 (-) Transcript_42022:604-924(-)
MTKVSFDNELTKQPIGITFDRAMKLYRNVVQEKYPTGTSTAAMRGRHLHEARTQNESKPIAKTGIGTPRCRGYGPKEWEDDQVPRELSFYRISVAANDGCTEGSAP